MTSEQQPADDLVARVLAHDRVACEELVRRHYAAVYRFLLHMTSDPHRAADFTQDTFQAAWQKLGEFDGRASIASWLHRIAYNKFVDAHRKGGRDRTAREYLQAELGGESVDEPCAATSKDTSQHLIAAVNRLPDDQRTTVILHYFEELSLKDTANVLGHPVGTVKWRLSAALHKLRSLVDAESVL